MPPGRYPLPAWRTLRFLLSVIWRLHLREPHWYVHVLGVHPGQQGTGLGRALLDPALALADRDRAPVYLETSNPRNLTFYGHFGFEVTREVRVPGGGPPLWTLLRPPVG